MEADRRQDVRQGWVVFGLAALSTTVTVASVGVRLAGALPAAPSGFAVLLSALVAGLNAAALRLVRPQQSLDARRWLALCGIGLIGPVWTACAWGGGWGLAAWITGLVIGGLAASLWQIPAVISPAADIAGQSPPIKQAQRVETPVPTSVMEPVASPVDNAGDVPTDSLLMRLERRQTDDEEQIELEYHLELAEGELHRTLHMPISPPLTTAPEVECEPLDDAGIDIQVAAAFTYGVRLELRRQPGSAPPLRTTIGIVLRAPLHRSSAA